MKPARFALTLFIIFMICVSAYSAAAFSTLALSRVDFSSNDPNLNKPAWLLTVVEDGNSQSATGTINHAQVTRSDGATAKNDLTINIANTQNQCQYTFQNSYTPVYNINMQDASYWSTESDCAKTTGCFFWQRYGVFQAKMFIRTQTAQITPLSTPTTLIQSTITAAANGETVSGTVNNIGAKNVMLGSRVYASWTGNLVSGAQCANPLDSQVQGVKQNGNFIIVDKAAVDQYDPNQNDFATCMSLPNPNFAGASDWQNCVDRTNAHARAVLIATARTPWTSASIGNGQALITQANLLQYPTITMRVDADWLGIYLPIGMPKIVSVTSAPFTEASNGIVTATIQNVGDSSASFAIGMSCGSPASFTGTSQTITIGKGATQNVNLQVTGQAKGTQIDSTCTVTATDVNNPANKDSKSVTVTIKPLAICQAGQQRCTGQNVEICNPAGTLWISSQVCPNGCQLTNGIAACAIAQHCSAATDCPAVSDATAECSGGNCRYTPVAATDWGKYGKLALWAVIFVIFAGLALYFDNKLWYIGSGVASVGIVLGFFSLFSPFAAWLLAFGFLAICGAIGLFALDMIGGAVALLAFGAIFIIVAIMVTTLQLPSWLGWL